MGGRQRAAPLTIPVQGEEKGTGEKKAFCIDFH